MNALIDWAVFERKYEMKRILALILVLPLAFVFVACRRSVPTLEEAVKFTNEDFEIYMGGYDRDELIGEWGEPTVTAKDKRADTWTVGDASVTIYWTETDSLKSGYSTVDGKEPFGFEFSGMSGDFARNGRFGVTVGLVNQQVVPYKWTGAVTEFRAEVKLVHEDGEIIITPEPAADTTENAEYEVMSGDVRKFDYYFIIPEDIPDGKYSLEVNFGGVSKTWEALFTLEG